MNTTAIPFEQPLLRGSRRPRVALVGRAGCGKSAVFAAAASPAVAHERLAGAGAAYQECVVDVGLDQISLVDLPALDTLHHLREDDRVVLQYLLWGDRWPAIARHESAQPTSAFAAPDVLLLVMDATALERDLELALELALLGRPLVIAINRMDEARAKGIYINVRTLAEQLGVSVVPTVAHMGLGLTELFAAAVRTARAKLCPLPQAMSRHIVASLETLNHLLARPEITAAFAVPRPLLLAQLAENDDYFAREFAAHFPQWREDLIHARAAAQSVLPRPLSEELHADRHHRAALLHEAVTRISSGRSRESRGWQGWMDALFLHPRWGLIGSLTVFALVLFMVFAVAAELDAHTSAKLAAWVQTWQPQSFAGVVTRAVLDALVGLVGIVLPYMIPLVILLVCLEQIGIMHRVAFVVDRSFHRIGLHGGVALPLLIGLGCNVPAISAAAASSSGRERVVASLLIAFVPCSARSAIILALGGKYLGGLGVFVLFTLTVVVIALLGKLLARHFAAAPGIIQEIPPYALPRVREVLASTWERTRDILTIVTPLLILGSVALALLSHFGADAWVNTLLTPVTHWWLGLPPALGVPILFGVLRKELSLLMIQQALGDADIGQHLDPAQIATFLVFLTFYVPCVSTFAVMLKTLGRKNAWLSVLLSTAAALALALVTRGVMWAFG